MLRESATLLPTLLLVSAHLLFGQSDANHGEVRGVVSDQQGDSIPAASVILHRPDIGLVRTVSSDIDGTYRFLLLPPGIYEMEAGGSGFQPVVMRNVQVTVGSVVSLNVELPLAVIRETMVVTGASELVEVGRSQQANTLDHDTISGSGAGIPQSIQSCFHIGGQNRTGWR